MGDHDEGREMEAVGGGSDEVDVIAELRASCAELLSQRDEWEALYRSASIAYQTEKRRVQYLDLQLRNIAGDIFRANDALSGIVRRYDSIAYGAAGMVEEHKNEEAGHESSI